MQVKKTSDFKRSIKTLATERGWLVETRGGKGPTECLVIYQMEGSKKLRIASIVLRADQKEMKPLVARLLLRNLRARVNGELVSSADEFIASQIEVLIQWITSWF